MSEDNPWTLRFSAHIGFLFGELPFGARFAAARKRGFTAVEHPSPFETPAATVRKYLDDAGLHYVQTGFPAGDASKGEKGFASLPEKRTQFRENIAPTLDYASEIGCKMVHAMAGVVPEGATRSVLWAEYLENLAYAADAARAYDIDVIVEPIGPGSIANYFIADPDIAIEAIKATSRSNVMLLMDVYHAISLGTEPLAFIRKHHAMVGHIQIADYPGRHEPGSSIVDFARVFQVLNDVGYGGHVGCEYHPSTSTEESFGWMRSYGESR
ncbi:hydroxypyruvate isomerase family protein [Rhizobium sp. GR12]|uniref:hydroxypyruvate isomerase family protein n=1 Tax=Rhizobium sp. GR12 TaxID=3053925 RepID=UPI002FBEC606